MILLGIADLGINLPVLIAQLVNFTILLVVLRLVAWGPLTKMLDERRERIRESLSAADQAKAQVAESERQVQEQVEAGRRDAQNLIARANFLTRQALHYQKALNRELHESGDHVWESTKSRIKSACEPLVEYLLFSEEAELTGRIQGTSGFAHEFALCGPRDRQGRSLRDFDLETRLFKFRCSYLIYSASFRALPGEARDYVLRRMGEVLCGQDTSKKFAHLSAKERQAILEILRETLPDLPDSWLEKSGT